MTFNQQRPRAVLLDRDGVINRAVRDGYVLETGDIEILPGSAQAIAALNAAGFTVLVVTNQQCVGKGLLPGTTLNAIHEHIRALIYAECQAVIDAFYCCPHLAADACACRKPKPGLIHQAQAEFHFEVARTFLIGDSYSDIATAREAGCPAIFVQSGLDAQRQLNGEILPHPNCLVAKDLAAAVDFVLAPLP